MEGKITRFIECLLPITACNLKCHYCYVIQRENRLMRKAKLIYPVDVMIKALTKERLGGITYISICGAGETMLQPELPELVLGLLKEGHYVNITTNGTITAAFKKIIEFASPKLLGRLNFSFSFHYIELLRHRYIERFFDNIKYVRTAGCSFVVQLNLCDEYEKYFDEISKLCLDNVGALPQLAATRDEINLNKDIKLLTKHSREEYEKIGNRFDSPLFRYTMKNFMVKRKEFCYAGKWSYVLDLETGILKPCYASQLRQNIFENVELPIKFTAIGNHCHSPFCMNSSHFISLGVIPSIKGPTYAALRNRKCVDGSEWYSPTMKEALSIKLYETNNPDEIDISKVRRQYMKDFFLGIPARILPSSLKKRIKHLLKK